jgi:hypothetical protein
MALALAETGPGGAGWNAGVAAAPLSSWRDQPFAAIRRASSRVSSLAAERRPVSSSQYVANGISLTFLPDHSGPQPIIFARSACRRISTVSMTAASCLLCPARTRRRLANSDLPSRSALTASANNRSASFRNRSWSRMHRPGSVRASPRDDNSVCANSLRVLADMIVLFSMDGAANDQLCRRMRHSDRTVPQKTKAAGSGVRAFTQF